MLRTIVYKVAFWAAYGLVWVALLPLRGLRRAWDWFRWGKR
jgi:hypothetical protein